MIDLRTVLAVLALAHPACTDETIRPDPSKSGGLVDASIVGDADSADVALFDADASTCPSIIGAAEMTRIASPKGVAYCIDKTEVTQGQYAKFVAAAGTDLSHTSAIAECAFTTSYDVVVRPDDNPGAYGCPKGVYDPTAKPDLPMQCATWCMAYAYCRWAGKRLCGRTGGGALTDTVADSKDPNASQWYNACSIGGKHAYPYGDSFLPACSPPALEPVTSASSECVGAEAEYSGISGMCSGVSEWEDGCTNEDCLVRGGNFLETWVGEGAFRCDRRAVTVRGLMHPFIGFRCCADTSG